MVKYSDTSNNYVGVRRQYKRMTKQSLQESSALDAQAGSLWVNEGQGAYLFAQNTVRMIGDPLAVQLEGEPKEQLQAKADVIRRLWSKYEERQARMRALASEEAKPKPKAGEKPDADKEAKEIAEKAKDRNADEKGDLSVKSVPTRIVERTVDGNYRIKGSQPFMIGPREYKIIVTGIVRSEDFNEEGIEASKLLDSKFDVVSVRRKEQDI